MADRLLYILHAIFSSLSRLFNAAVLGGERDETTSSRIYWETEINGRWGLARRVVDKAAFIVSTILPWAAVQIAHCADAFTAHEHRAAGTLGRAARIAELQAMRKNK